MKVFIPTPLRSYTGDKAVIEASGNTVGAALGEIERLCPGFRFRIVDEQDGIRPHIRIFVNTSLVRDLSAAARPDDVLHIICALSGG